MLNQCLDKEAPACDSGAVESQSVVVDVEERAPRRLASAVRSSKSATRMSAAHVMLLMSPQLPQGGDPFRANDSAESG